VAALGVLVGLIGVGLGLFAWLASPGRCESATFTSTRFAYCLTTPTGWTGEEVNQDGNQYDRFTQADAAAVVFVAADRIQGNDTLDDLVTQFRKQATDQGFTIEEAVETRVGGQRAVQWDGIGTDDSGTRYAFRSVMFHRNGYFWFVQLNDLEDEFDLHTGALARMLQTWTFT
jgi:hypothetical protein